MELGLAFVVLRARLLFGLCHLKCEWESDDRKKTFREKFGKREEMKKEACGRRGERERGGGW